MKTMNSPAVGAAATHAESLIRRFRNRDACVAVVGLGYVGLPLACRFADAGFRTFRAPVSEKARTSVRPRERSTDCRDPGETGMRGPGDRS